MKGAIRIHSVSKSVSAIVMILALVWLTVSTPFVFAAQQELVKQQKTEKPASSLPGSEEESSNPFGNNTEEKTTGNNSVSEEFIHDHHITGYYLAEVSQFHKSRNVDIYTAFHGELLVPPPNLL